jgi:hypothetical protein
MSGNGVIHFSAATGEKRQPLHKTIDSIGWLY